jgi:hypothetical protein
MIIFDLFEDANKKPLAEFAPSDSSNGDDGFSEETLKQLAAQWYNGDEDPEVERTLMAAGWEIGQDEGYDDEPGVFVVQAGDVNGNSYISWPADELRQGISEGEFTISDDPAAHIKLLFLKTINGNEYRLVKQGDVYNIYINRSRKSKQEFSSFDLAKRALQQLLLNAVHSDQQGVTEGQYEIQLVPNVVNITYGRDVGYKIEQESFDDATHAISATKIRKQMGVG